MVETECSHDRIESERIYDERPEGTNPLGIYGVCLDCGINMTPTGDEDEDGHPTWTEDYTADEMVQIRRQS